MKKTYVIRGEDLNGHHSFFFLHEQNNKKVRHFKSSGDALKFLNGLKDGSLRHESKICDSNLLGCHFQIIPVWGV